MENFQWLAPLKTSVMLMFFVTFVSIVIVTLTGRTDDRWARLPLAGETPDSQTKEAR